MEVVCKCVWKIMQLWKLYTCVLRRLSNYKSCIQVCWEDYAIIMEVVSMFAGQMKQLLWNVML